MKKAPPSKAARELKALREEAGLSVRALAKLLKKPASTYATYEDRYKKQFLPIELANSLVPIFEARGIPQERTIALAVPTQEGVLKTKSPLVTDYLPADNPVGDEPSDVRLAANAPEVIPWTYPRDIKIMGTLPWGDDDAFEIDQSDPINFALRTPGLAGVKDVYAYYSQTTLMGRSYKPGALIYVHSRMPIVPDCDVVIQIKPAGEGLPTLSYLRTFVSRNATGWLVKQWTPEKEFNFPINRVLAVHRVLTLEQILSA